MVDNIIWDTELLRVYTDYSGDIVFQERPSISADFIFVNPDELLAFCKHYVSLAESKEWRPYPENKPTESDIYLVTVRGPRTKMKWVQRDIYDAKLDEWESIYVTAWMPLPDVFEGKE